MNATPDTTWNVSCADDSNGDGITSNATCAWALNTAAVPTIPSASSRAVRSRDRARTSTTASTRMIALNM